MITPHALVLAAALIFQPAPAGTGEASIEITFEVGAGTGAIMAALFDSQGAYEGGAPVRSLRLDVAAGERTARFEGLPPGDYALKSFHDVDGDGRMNANPFGMPTEPYAFSNNAVGNMGPASWERARFTVDGAVRQTLSLR